VALRRPGRASRSTRGWPGKITTQSTGPWAARFQPGRSPSRVGERGSDWTPFGVRFRRPRHSPCRAGPGRVDQGQTHVVRSRFRVHSPLIDAPALDRQRFGARSDPGPRWARAPSSRRTRRSGSRRDRSVLHQARWTEGSRLPLRQRPLVHRPTLCRLPSTPRRCLRRPRPSVQFCARAGAGPPRICPGSGRVGSRPRCRARRPGPCGTRSAASVRTAVRGLRSRPGRPGERAAGRACPRRAVARSWIGVVRQSLFKG
jgi:hypothetical protein